MALEHACVCRNTNSRDSVSGSPVSQYSTVFAPWLDGIDLNDGSSGDGLFTCERTFWLFLSQILSADGSCQEAVSRAIAWILAEENVVVSTSSSAYCQARRRLKLEFLDTVLRKIITSVQERSGQCWNWHNKRVKVADGSTLSMPDTPENQHAWPQPDGQKPGCGFPCMRLVGMFCLATGSLLGFAYGNLRDSEKGLWPMLWDWLDRGDVVLADRGFCSFATFYLLLQRSVDSVVRLNEKRLARVVKKLGRQDSLVEWLRSGSCPAWLDKSVWDAMPESLVVRYVTFSVPIKGFRTRVVTVATTLLDPVEYPASELAALYRRRWQVELLLRDIKITMGMDVLRCKTPEMIHREVLMHLIAYNLVRAVTAEAAAEYGAEPSRISFKAAVQFLRQHSFPAPLSVPLEKAALEDILLYYVGSCRIPCRPDRTEPRARKRRPKNYQLLTQPRHLFREISHRNRYTAPPAAL